jgi:hypothetical protein
MIRLGIAVLALMGLSSAVLAAMTPEQRAAILVATTDFSAPERWEILSGDQSRHLESRRVLPALGQFELRGPGRLLHR